MRTLSSINKVRSWKNPFLSIKLNQPFISPYRKYVYMRTRFFLPSFEYVKYMVSFKSRLSISSAQYCGVETEFYFRTEEEWAKDV